VQDRGIYRQARPAADLAGQVQCLWYRRVGQDEAARPVRVMPDGCMDLIWMLGELHVAGPDTTAWVARLPAGTEIAGLRFRPGVAPAVLGIPATELVNDRLAAGTIWPRRAAEVVHRLEAVQSLASATVVLQDTVRQLLVEAPAPDHIVQQVVKAIQRTSDHPTARVERLADQVGISERQLHRRCCAALGYGPKTLARIVRFRRFLASAHGPTPPTLIDIAAITGYADQPHLTREVRRLAGLSPTELLAELAD
jgi:AraC-like DNA-binding protein